MHRNDIPKNEEFDRLNNLVNSSVTEERQIEDINALSALIRWHIRRGLPAWAGPRIMESQSADVLATLAKHGKFIDQITKNKHVTISVEDSGRLVMLLQDSFLETGILNADRDFLKLIREIQFDLNNWNKKKSAVVDMLHKCELLEVLDLGEANDIESTRAILKKMPKLSSLKCLNLNDSYVTDEEIFILSINPSFENLTTLMLGKCQIGDQAIFALSDSHHLSKITHLELNDSNITNMAILRLATKSNFANLAHLDLGGCNIDNQAILALANSPYLSNLSFLNLGNCRSERSLSINDDSARIIADSPYLNNLTHLHFGDSYVADAGLAALANSPNSANLVSLSLTESDDDVCDFEGMIGDGFIQLASSPNFLKMKHLEIGGRNMQGEGILSAFAASPYLSGLKSLSLELDGNIEKVELINLVNSLSLSNLELFNLQLSDVDDIKNNDEVAKNLANNPSLQNLLSLTMRQVGDSGIAAISQSPYIRKLQNLELADGNIGDDGIKSFVNSEIMSNLELLDFSYCKIGDEGIKALANATKLTNLIGLKLNNNIFGDEGIKALASSQTLVNLKHLDLDGCKIGDAGLMALANSADLLHLDKLILSDTPNAAEILKKSPYLTRCEILLTRSC